MPRSEEFDEPPWLEPLNADEALEVIPRDASISGMFYQALQAGAAKRQLKLAFPEPRYLPFRFYPLRTFSKLLLDASKLFHPQVTLREGLRRIGRVGPSALLQSTLGKVTLGSAVGVYEAVTAFGRVYPVNVRPSRCEVRERGDNWLILDLSIPYFLDCHHVGAFEGALAYAGVNGSVRLTQQGPIAASMLLEWS